MWPQILAFGIVGLALATILYKDDIEQYTQQRLATLTETIEELLHGPPHNDELNKDNNDYDNDMIDIQNDDNIQHNVNDNSDNDIHTMSNIRINNSNNNVRQRRLHNNNNHSIDVCSLCLDNPVTTVYIPCGHSKTCISCNNKLKDSLNELNSTRSYTNQLTLRCSFCNQKIQSIHRIYR